MKINKFYILMLALIIVLVGGFFINQKFGKASPIASSSPSVILSPSPEESATPMPTPSKTSNTIPSAYLIKNFPFQSQAPLGNWDALHEESCEEASLILVKFWQDGKSLSAQTMEDEIQKIVAWENANGYPQDVTLSQLSQVALDYYGMEKPEADYNITIEDIKKSVAQNRPIIIPAAGRLLGNPYFTAPGPIYHMVVVIGYQGNIIIVQDVGTRRGNNYQYNQEVFYNAIHDWAGSKENITSGRKAMLVF